MPVEEESHVELWTWQGPNFNIHAGTVDSTIGEYADQPGYLLALQEVAKHLKTDQFIWASRKRDPHWGRVGYKLRVPPAHVLAVLDGFIWNRRLGNRVRPPEVMLLAWDKEAASLHPMDGRHRRAYVDERTHEWHNQPLPGNWWEQAIVGAVKSEDPQYLLQYPIPRESVLLDRVVIPTGHEA